MKLKNLQISNFRCFESLSIDLDEQLTVLVAENGVGKTAILDAIAVALGPFIGGFDTGVRKDFKYRDARIGIKNGPHLSIKFSDDEYRPQGSASKRMESKYPISLVASGMVEGQFETWSRELTGEKTQTTFGKAKNIIDYAKKLQQQVRADEQVSLPIVAYYGTGRLWRQSQASKRTSAQSDSRLYGYHDALNPDSTYKAFEKWFTDKSLVEYHHIFIKHSNNLKEILNNIDKTKADNLKEILNNADKNRFEYTDVSNNIKKNPIDSEDRNRSDETASYSTELDHVRKAINRCISISGWKTLEYDLEWRELVVRFNHGRPGFDTFIPAAQLSDGVKAMLSLTADIAYRCVQLNPHLASPTEETTGIVLIDEIDLHLHPKWQQTVLSDLRKAFLKIQFIVTTHSPQVISTVPSHQIRILDGNQVYSAEAGTKGAESSRILKRIFGVDPRPKDDPNTKKLNEYLDLVYADKWTDGEAKRKELDDIYQGNEPELTKADLYIENRQWELEIEENQ